MKFKALLRFNWKNFTLERGYASQSLSPSVQRRNALFEEEKARQLSQVGRVEKIQVRYLGKPQPLTLAMNRGISTPYNVAQHINEWVCKRSALALVDGEKVWDMGRPLEGDCSVEFLDLGHGDPHHANRAFWRTSSFLLGATVADAFDPAVRVLLHSFPSPQISSGSFTYDAELSLDDWRPTVDELRVLSGRMVSLAGRELPLERLEVDEPTASALFQDNPFKARQIPDIAQHSGGKVTVYRAGTHVDISKGPLIGNTSLIGRCSITAVHQIEKDGQKLYRFQGVALPQGILLNHFAYKILEERSSKLNTLQQHPPSAQSKQELMAH